MHNHLVYLIFFTLVASSFLLANVSATRIGNTKVASLNILTYLACSRSLPQVYASDIFAPESLPS